MESHVLMPEALSLSVQRPSSSSSSSSTGLCSAMPIMSVARMLEQSVTVVAARKVNERQGDQLSFSWGRLKLLINYNMSGEYSIDTRASSCNFA